MNAPQQSWSQPQPQPRLQPQSGAPTPQLQPPQSSQEVKHHVHHSYIWLESVRTFAIFACAIVVANFSAIVGVVADGGLDGIAPGLLMAVVAGGTLAVVLVVGGLIVLTRWLSYRYLYFTVGAHEFALCSGVFNKKRVHVPYQRVQSVDQRATLLQRIFGVCTVSIDTAGGAANKAIVVPYVTKQQAEWLRVELYRRKESQVRMEALQAAQAAQVVGQPLVAGQRPWGAASFCENPSAHGAAELSQNGTVPQGCCPAAAPTAASGVAPVSGNVLDVGAQAWDEVGGLFAGAAVNTGRVTYEHGLTNKELFLAGLSGTPSVGLVFAGVLVAISQVVSFVFDMFGDAANSMVEGALYTLGSQATGYLIGVISVSLIGVVVFMWLVSALASCVSLGGFKARRRDNRIEVEYGLLRHTFQGVAIDRVQSVVVKQSFIRRLLGYCELSLGKIDAVDDAGGNSSEAGAKNTLVGEGIVVHPFVKMNRVPEILAGLAPEFADLPRESIPVAKVAARRALVRRGIIQGGGFWLAVLSVIGLVVLNLFGTAVRLDGLELLPDEAAALGFLSMMEVMLLALAVVLFIVDIVGALLWARESSFAYNRRFMQVSNGGLSRTTISFPRQKIQFGCVRANPLQRRAGTATVLATTAAGSGGTTTALIDVSAEAALAWLDWLKPGGNMVK